MASTMEKVIEKVQDWMGDPGMHHEDDVVEPARVMPKEVLPAERICHFLRDSVFCFCKFPAWLWEIIILSIGVLLMTAIVSYEVFLLAAACSQDWNARFAFARSTDRAEGFLWTWKSDGQSRELVAWNHDPTEAVQTLEMWKWYGAFVPHGLFVVLMLVWSLPVLVIGGDCWPTFEQARMKDRRYAGRRTCLTVHSRRRWSSALFWLVQLSLIGLACASSAIYTGDLYVKSTPGELVAALLVDYCFMHYAVGRRQPYESNKHRFGLAWMAMFFSKYLEADFSRESRARDQYIMPPPPIDRACARQLGRQRGRQAEPVSWKTFAGWLNDSPNKRGRFYGTYLQHARRRLYNHQRRQENGIGPSQPDVFDTGHNGDIGVYQAWQDFGGDADQGVKKPGKWRSRFEPKDEQGPLDKKGRPLKRRHHATTRRSGSSYPAMPYSDYRPSQAGYDTTYGHNTTYGYNTTTYGGRSQTNSWYKGK